MKPEIVTDFLPFRFNKEPETMENSENNQSSNPRRSCKVKEDGDDGSEFGTDLDDGDEDAQVD